MKTTFFKLGIFAAGVTMAAFACVKPQPSITKPVTADCNLSDPGTAKCDFTAKGTIEKCIQDGSIWFINATSFPSKVSNNGVTRLLLPVNLDPSFKSDGLTVSFDYNELADSVVLDCGLCETYPPLYAKKIKLCSIRKDSTIMVVKKPNIYLYPTRETKVDVKLNYKGRLIATYPDYDNKFQGWSVIAQKDGTLKNLADNREYQYLFWEGTPETPYNFNMLDGFCVKGSDTKSFLQNMLPKLGLTPKEYNEMIVFWLPQMMNNPYNLIHFATDEYTKSAPLTITPKPDRLIRVFMAFEPSNEFIKTNEPIVVTPDRKGFTVVEWGGVEMPKAGYLPHNAL